jgi:hypothetical protein
MIKENLPNRVSGQIAQSFRESTFDHLSNQYDSKKIKKSGLTIFKPAEN